MPKRRVLAVLLASVLSAGLLAGCITSLAPTQVLPRSALASVSEVALAVGADGVKHYAWTECFGEDDTYTCALVYTRVVLGVVVYSYGFVTPIGTFARYPDVAVSSTGDAYVVRSVCTDFNTCYDYVSFFPAADPESIEPDSELLHSSAVKSEDRPVITARGEDVYAAYFIKVSAATRLRYRQLSGGVREGYIDNSTLSPVSPSLAVDSAGDLHAVWVRNPLADTFVAYSDNTGAVNDFHAATTFEGGSDKLITAPALALDDDDRVYLAYGINNASDDTIMVRCLDTGVNCYRGATALTVPQAGGDWNVYGSVHLALINDQPNVVFAATNTVVLSNDVWWYHPPNSGGDVPPTQVTNTANKSEGEPLIVEENSTAGDVGVVAWRQFQFIFSGQAPAGNSGFCAGDVFVTYGDESHTRQVFSDRGACQNSGLDLASNGAWVAGVWVDEDPDVISAHAAWTDFNALVTYLPVTRR